MHKVKKSGYKHVQTVADIEDSLSFDDGPCCVCCIDDRHRPDPVTHV